MVLEEATASSPDAFSDSFNADPTTTSTGDPQNAPGQITIDLSTLPRPVPIVGPLLGYTTARTARTISDGLAAATQIMKRPLMQPEADALAYYYAKAVATGSWGTTLGCAAAAYRCAQTASTFRFPFFTPPKEGFDPEVCGPLRGPAARAGWHALRAAPYLFLGGFIGMVVGQSYGATVAAVSMAQDKRLVAFNEQLKRIGSERRSGLPREPARVPGAEGTAAGRTAQPAVGRAGEAMGAGDMWPSREAEAGAGDDMSPKGGMGPFEDVSTTTTTTTTTDTGVLSDRQMRQQEVAQRADPRSSPARNTENTFRMDKVTSQPRSFDSDYDDASPTGGGFGASTPDRSSSGSGSAWDRIRRQAATGQTLQSSSRDAAPRQQQQQQAFPGDRRAVQREQREGATLGDSFSFSATEEERQLAKAEAQREFDARVERERKGGDFEDAGRRW